MSEHITSALQRIRTADFSADQITDVIIKELNNQCSPTRIGSGVVTTFEPWHGRAWAIWVDDESTVQVKRINGNQAGTFVP